MFFACDSLIQICFIAPINLTESEERKYEENCKEIERYILDNKLNENGISIFDMKEDDAFGSLNDSIEEKRDYY